jgi:hypothetical protein
VLRSDRGVTRLRPLDLNGPRPCGLLRSRADSRGAAHLEGVPDRPARWGTLTPGRRDWREVCSVHGGVLCCRLAERGCRVGRSTGPRCPQPLLGNLPATGERAGPTFTEGSSSGHLPTTCSPAQLGTVRSADSSRVTGPGRRSRTSTRGPPIRQSDQLSSRTRRRPTDTWPHPPPDRGVGRDGRRPPHNGRWAGGQWATDRARQPGGDPSNLCQHPRLARLGGEGAHDHGHHQRTACR